MLKIEDLHASIDGKEILRGLELSVGAGEVHAIMGPNGSGKSTLANVLGGRDGCDVTRGRVTFFGQDLLALAPEERAREGLFIGFQYPVELPGVSNLYFLKAALNAVRRHRGEPELDALEFVEAAHERMALVELGSDLVRRPVNEGFSGGEKKRNEVFQMLMLQPRLAVLDETDSGLDIDALRVVARGIESLRDAGRSILLITHYQRLLEHVVPDFVHVLVDGRIVRSGDRGLALELEAGGYASFGGPQAAAAT